MGIDRGALVLRAGTDGAVPSVAVQFPPALFVLDDTDGGGVSPGLVLVGLETAPGRVPPSDYFHASFIDADGRDVLHGCGWARHPRRRTYAVIRDARGHHPLIRPGETLHFEITGNTRPGAEIRITLSYAPVLPTTPRDRVQRRAQ